MLPTKSRWRRFWQGRISFPAIARVVEETLQPDAAPGTVPASTEILEIDRDARRVARDVIETQADGVRAGWRTASNA